MEASTPCDHRGKPRVSITVKEASSLRAADGAGVTFCKACGRALTWGKRIKPSEAQTAASKYMVDNGLWKYTKLPDGNMYGEQPVPLQPDEVDFAPTERPPLDGMPLSDLVNRFKFHQEDENTGPKRQAIREECFDLATFIDALVPDGREKSTAITKIEEAMMWANAGIIRNG